MEYNYNMIPKGFDYIYIFHGEVCYNKGRSAGENHHNEASTSGVPHSNETLKS